MDNPTKGGTFGETCAARSCHNNIKKIPKWKDISAKNTTHDECSVLVLKPHDVAIAYKWTFASRRPNDDIFR